MFIFSIRSIAIIMSNKKTIYLETMLRPNLDKPPNLDDEGLMGVGHGHSSSGPIGYDDEVGKVDTHHQSIDSDKEVEAERRG